MGRVIAGAPALFFVGFLAIILSSCWVEGSRGYSLVITALPKNQPVNSNIQAYQVAAVKTNNIDVDDKPSAEPLCIRISALAGKVRDVQGDASTMVDCKSPNCFSNQLPTSIPRSMTFVYEWNSGISSDVIFVDLFSNLQCGAVGSSPPTLEESFVVANSASLDVDAADPSPANDAGVDR